MDAPSFDSEVNNTGGGGAAAAFEPAARGGMTPLCAGCFRTHRPKIDVAAKLGIQEKWWVLAMVSLVFTCEWIDRALLNVALEPMKIDLALSDTQVGAVASSSYWVAVISVLPIGRFADTSSRRDVIACALCIWALGTVLTGFAGSFHTVCLARMVVGLGTAGFFPVTEAFIADNFEAEERGRAYGVFGWAFMQGYLLGFSGGGWLVQEYGWQDTFIFVGAPQCLLALFFHLTVPSPPAIKPTNSVLVDIQILARKTPLRAIWAGMFITTVGAAMNKFLPSFYQRVHGLSVAETGFWLGTGTGVVSGLGGMACGFIVDRVYKNSGKDPTVWFKMMALGQVLAFPIYVGAISVDATYLALFLSASAGVPQGLVGPSQNTAQMAVVPQQLRATTTGMAEVCWTGANAVGPIFGGILSDMLGDPNKSADEGDNSGLVKMLLIGAIIPLGQAFIVWHWRSSVSDELSWSEATHVVVADYKPSFERALAASKGEEMVRLPQSTENAEWIKVQRVSDTSAQGWMPTAFLQPVAAAPSSTSDGGGGGGGLGAGLVVEASGAGTPAAL